MNNLIVIDPRPYEMIARFEIWMQSLGGTATTEQVEAYCRERAQDPNYVSLLVYITARAKMTLQHVAARN